MADYTPALTLWPEWAWAIDLPHPLAKRVECRGYTLPIGVWIYLHAGKHIGGRPGFVALESGLSAVTDTAYAAGLDVSYAAGHAEGGYIRVATFVAPYGACLASPVLEQYSRRPIVTSAILGRFRVSHAIPPGLTEICDGVRCWKVLDSYGNVFQYQRLNQPVPCKGAQGLWRLPVEVEMEIANVGFEVTNG